MKGIGNITEFIFLAVLYFGACISIYALIQSPAVTLVGIIPVGYLSWKRGLIPGFILAFINWNLTGIVITIVTPKLRSTMSKEAAVTSIVYIGCVVLMGYIGRLSRKLQKEIITRKEAENELKNYQNHLEEIVEQRTRELERTNEQLHQMEKMESIGQLAGGVAHDFNNFINIILGYSKMIAKNKNGDTCSRDNALKIERTAKTASELTSQLLLFARKEEFTQEQIDVNDLVAGIISLLSHGLNKNIVVNSAIEPGLPLITGGRSQIQNALLNLAFNARDAMLNGGTMTFGANSITVSADFIHEQQLTCEPGHYVNLSVADSGTGITETDLKRIFEPFYTTKERGKGTGMGLATVYGIAKSHKGAVHVATEVDKGTTFSLFFPVAA